MPTKEREELCNKIYLNLSTKESETAFNECDITTYCPYPDCDERDNYEIPILDTDWCLRWLRKHSWDKRVDIGEGLIVYHCVTENVDSFYQIPIESDDLLTALLRLVLKVQKGGKE